MLSGVFTALVTPFKEGKIDFSSLENLVNNQLQAGIHGFVVCGTTGESVTLSEEEQFKVLSFVCEKAKGKVKILFGSGSNSTSKTISMSVKACEYPIDGLLVVVPYYNKPPQEGLLAHFRAVADASPKPIVLYNVPGRTITPLEPDSIISLSQHPNIMGVKEANGDLNNFKKYKDKVPQDFSLFSGDDESCVDFCLLGGHGVISVCSHIAPKEMVNYIHRARQHDPEVSQDFQSQQPWIKSLYLTSNPIPVKAALQLKGIISTDEMRLPLVAMNETLKNQMTTTMKQFKGLL